MFAKINRVGLLKNGMFIDYVDHNFVKRSFLQYSHITNVSCISDMITINYIRCNDIYTYYIKDVNVKIVSRSFPDSYGIENLYRKLTLEYLTSYHNTCSNKD